MKTKEDQDAANKISAALNRALKRVDKAGILVNQQVMRAAAYDKYRAKISVLNEEFNKSRERNYKSKEKK